MNNLLPYFYQALDMVKELVKTVDPLFLVAGAAGFAGFIAVLVAGGRGKGSIPPEVEDLYNAYLKVGDQVKAAEVLVKYGFAALAFEILESAGARYAMADLLVKMERFEEAGAIYEDLGRITEAASMYLKAGKPMRAEAVMREGGNYLGAAIVAEKSNEHYAAARNYEEIELYAAAAEAYFRVADNLKAAENFEKAWERARRRGGGGSFTGRYFARRAAEAYEKAGEFRRAAEMALAAGAMDLAARLNEKAGERIQAARCYLEAGMIDDAYRIASTIKAAGPDALVLMGRIYERHGDSSVAASFYKEAGDYANAARLYELSGEKSLAAQMYEKLGRLDKAFELYAQVPEHGKAAEVAEKLGRFEEAAEHYGRAGNIIKQAASLVKAGQLTKAGHLLVEQGLYDRALAILQKVPKDDPEYPHVLADMTRILKTKGMDEAAREKLEDYISTAGVTEENVTLFYSLASIYEDVEDYNKAAEVYRTIIASGINADRAVERLKSIEEMSMRRTEPAPSDTKSLEVTDTEEFKKKYQIIEEVGIGGMGVVYKARDLFLDRLVALKILPKSVRDNPKAQRNLMKEAKAAASLNHPNIVTVYEAGFLNNILYIAMEYIDGVTLAQLKEEDGVLEGKLFLYVFGQVTRALAYAHKNGIVHGDVKPGNIMWTENKIVKITDFGLARALEELKGGVTTVAGGTPYYMSPEQVLGSGLDQRSDIYSLGATMYEMIAGRPPFTEGDVGYHHIHTPPEPVSKVKPGVHPEIERIIMKCLEKDPAKRYQNMEEIFEDLKKVVKGK